MLIAAWGDERQPGQAAVVLHAGQPGVALEFESHAWKAESKRRQRRGPVEPPRFAQLDAPLVPRPSQSVRSARSGSVAAARRAGR